VIFGQKQKQTADSEQWSLLRAQYEADTERRALLRAQYEEVCRSYHAIDDFRAKLLALLPIGGGAVGIGLILGENVRPAYLVALAIFGFCVTAGLGVYEVHQGTRCRFLRCRAKELEEELDLEGKGLFSSEAGVDYGPFQQGLAGWIVYLTAAAGWIFIFSIGVSELSK
jgi:hypothetical protein